MRQQKQVLRARERGLLPVLVAILVLAAAAGFFGLATQRGGHADSRHATPAFLTKALGTDEPSAPLLRTPAPGVSVAIHQGGYALATPAGTIALTAKDHSAGSWSTYRNGASRPTALGRETVTVAPNRTELFQTVTQHKGQKTWSWKLDTASSPQVTRGYVAFFSKTGELLPLQIDPVQILDSRGKPVTPHGLEWGVDRKGGAWWLTLRLDDTKLAAAVHDRPCEHVHDFYFRRVDGHGNEHRHDPGDGSGGRPSDRPAVRGRRLDCLPDRADRQQRRHLDEPRRRAAPHGQPGRRVPLRNRD